MSHTNTGRIMADANGGIDIIRDIGAVLGTGKGDIGDIITDQAIYINKFAAYKPVRSDKIGIMTRADFAAKNFGLTAPNTRRYPAQTIGDEWVYARPRGNTVSPIERFRVMDFNGYYSEADPPCKPIGDISVALATSSIYSFGDKIVISPSGGESVTWEELDGSISSFYLCVIFAKNADMSGDQLGKTSVQTLGSNGIELDIVKSELEELQGDGYKYYYLCATSASDADNPSTGYKGSQSLSNPYNWTARDFISLPTLNGASDVNGKFTITAAPIQNIIIQSVTSVQSPTRALQFFDATNYRGTDELIPTNNKYFKVTDSLNNGKYYFQIGLSVTAGNQSFTLGNNAINLSQTFVSQGGFTSKKNVTLYDTDASGNLVQANQITIPAGQTKVVYLATSLSALMSLNINGVEEVNTNPQYFSVRVFIYQGSPSTLIGQDDIRVRNYDF